MAQYRKKPVVIEAFQWLGTNSIELGKWHEKKATTTFSRIIENENTCTLTIPTLEGDMEASVGDFIICGVKGEYYPCKPDVFAITYERV